MSAIMPIALPFLFGCLQYVSNAMMAMFVTIRPVIENSRHYSAIPTKLDPKVRQSQDASCHVCFRAFIVNFSPKAFAFVVS